MDPDLEQGRGPTVLHPGSHLDEVAGSWRVDQLHDDVHLGHATLVLRRLPVQITVAEELAEVGLHHRLLLERVDLRLSRAESRLLRLDARELSLAEDQGCGYG